MVYFKSSLSCLYYNLKCFRATFKWYNCLINIRIKFLEKVRIYELSYSVLSDSLWPHELAPARLLCPWGFSRQEYWSGVACPPPGDLSDPEIEPKSPTFQADSLPCEPPRKPNTNWILLNTFSLNCHFPVYLSYNLSEVRSASLLHLHILYIVDVHIRLGTNKYSGFNVTSALSHERALS